jgi:predicted hydrocarbon binding protein
MKYLPQTQIIISYLITCVRNSEKDVKINLRREVMVDPDILLLAIVNASEGVRALIGDRGAKAVLRDAGRQAGPRLLESLIGHFPEVLNKEEALKRACIILEDLGFAKSIKIEDGNIVIEEDLFTDAIVGENLSDSPIIYFFAGLIEGFVSFMSDEKVVLVPEVVERGKIIYKYS